MKIKFYIFTPVLILLMILLQTNVFGELSAITNLGPMNEASANFAASKGADGKIYVFGGIKENGLGSSGVDSSDDPDTPAFTVLISGTGSEIAYTLSVVGLGDGSGVITDSATGGLQISCVITNGVATGDCSEQYTPSSVVTLTANPLEGSAFMGWGEGVCSGTGICAVNVNSDILLTATFNTIKDLPDLMGTWTDISKKVKKNKYIVKGKLTVQNVGTQPADKVTASIYLSYDQTYDSSDTYLGYKNFKKMNVGKTKSKSFKFKFETDPAGYYLIAVIDPDCEIQEIYENNNMPVSDAIPPPRLLTDPLDNWHWRADVPTLSFTDIVYTSNTFVAVAPSTNMLMGGIITSTDGYNWTMRDSGDHDYLNGIAYANGRVLPASLLA